MPPCGNQMPPPHLIHSGAEPNTDNYLHYEVLLYDKGVEKHLYAFMKSHIFCYHTVYSP